MALPDPHEIPKPRAVTARGWAIAIVVTLFVGIAYLLVAVFYNVEGGVTFTGANPDSGEGIAMRIEPVAVDAARGSATLHLSFQSTDPALIDPETQRTLVDVRFLIASLSGSQELKFPAGVALGQQDIAVGVSGEQAQYPFDTHSGYVTVIADTYDKKPDGSVVSTGAIPINTSMGESEVGYGVNGWDTTIEARSLPASVELEVVFQRAFSTQVFALVLLGLVVLLAGIALAVGLLTATRRRRVEVGLMAYGASLVFALPALRQYLPNAPPIGASIDVYLYLWVIVAAIVAITLIVISWMSQTRTALLSERAAAKAAVAAAEQADRTDPATGD